MRRSPWRWTWLLAVLAGIVLVVVSGVFLIVAYDGARHGWASLRHAAPVPLAGIVVGIALAVVGIVRLARRG